MKIQTDNRIVPSFVGKLRIRSAIRTTVVRIFLLGMALSLVACSDGGTEQVVTIANAPVLELPTQLEAANPNVRKLMKPKVSYGTDSNNLAEVPTVRNGDENEVVRAIDVPSEDQYFVKIEWVYPQNNGTEGIRLGELTYNIEAENEMMERSVNIASEFVAETVKNGPSGFTNIQLLNSLYRGDDTNDLANGINTVAIDEYAKLGLIGIDYIPNYQSGATLDDTLAKPGWGLNSELLFSNDAGDLPEAFTNVSWSAVYSDEEIYIQIRNSDASKNPFVNPVLITIGNQSFGASPIALSEGAPMITVPPGSTAAGPNNAVYGYSANRVDYRQSSLPATGSNELKIQFFDPANSTAVVAQWTGRILIAPLPEAAQSTEGQVTIEILQQSRVPADGFTFRECDPILLAATLNGETGVGGEIVFTYAFTPITPNEPGTVSNVASNENNFLLPVATGEGYVLEVIVTAVRQSDMQSFTSDPLMINVSDDDKTTCS